MADKPKNTRSARPVIRVGEKRSIRGYVYTVTFVGEKIVRASDRNQGSIRRDKAGWARLPLIAEGPSAAVSKTYCPAAYSKRFTPVSLPAVKCQECGRQLRLRQLRLPRHLRP